MNTDSLQRLTEQTSGLRQLQQTLAQVADPKLCEIVSLVDSLPVRGATDALIDPLRPRLRQIRPPRRMNITRLLFQPADPVITATTLWRRTTLALPRSALASLANQIRQAEPDLCGRIEADLDPSLSRDPDRLIAIGRPLWAASSRVLSHSAVAVDWSATTGLAAADYFNVARPLSAVLAEAATIELLVALDPQTTSSHQRSIAIRSCLSRSVNRLPAPAPGMDPNLPVRCLGMLICVLLARLPGAEAVLIAAQGVPDGATARLAAESALDTALEHIDSTITRDAATLDARNLASCADLLETLDQSGPAGRPLRRKHIAELRRRLGETCRNRFTGLLNANLLPPSTGHAAAPTGQAAEDVARELRQLEAVSRHFGTTAYYEQHLHKAAETLARIPVPAANRVALARVIEILQGPEAALALLASP